MNTNQSTDQLPLPSPIPTDHLQLTDLMIRMPRGDWADVLERLRTQVGPEQAQQLWDTCSGYACNAQDIALLRAKLRQALETGLQSLAAAQLYLDRLGSPEIYDVEYTEGGSVVADLRAHLADAARSARAAAAANPIKD